MTTWNLNKLLNGIKSRSNIVGGIVKYYSKVIELFDGLKTNNFDFFVAGYMIGSNITIKEKLLKLRSMDEKIRD